jgi:glucokinase
MKYAIGVDLGGTNIKFALVEESQGIVKQTSIETNAEQGPDHVQSQMALGIRQMYDFAEDVENIVGVGVGAPGTISWDRTTISHPPNLPDWKVVNLARTLPQLTGLNLPVRVENDANLAGLGCAFYGVGKDFDSFVMVTLGTGVGGAIIYNNEIFRGSTGGAGELGHVSVDYEGPKDRAGMSGALEAYLGQRFLSRHARYWLLNRPESVIHQMNAGDDLLHITPKMLHEGALQGDEGCIEVLAWAGHKLGFGLASVVNLLDIRKLIVGGGVSAAGDFILEPARRALRENVITGFRDGVELMREPMGNDVALLGAAKLAMGG